ncbi:MAG: glycosyltransferase [Sphaerochaeta sp.]|nr:glycosyltransferase [Sphaerochaeta sp.]
MRREAWERAGGYRQRYAPQGQGAEDAELWLRLGALGWGGVKASDEPLFLYTAGGRTQQPGFRKNIDWLSGHPWVRDGQHPFASLATPARGSHPARSYDEPLVSVVIPVSERHLPLLVDALDSVEAQTLRRWEVIMAYDGKLDENTRSWLQSGFPYVKIEETGKPSGAACARNVGAAAARAPFLLFLDADDVIDPRALEHMLGAVEELEEPAIIYTSSRGLLSLTPEDARKFKAAGELVSYQDGVALIEQRAAEYDCKLAVRQPGEHKQYFWCYVTSLVPRAWHEELGGFDEHLPTWEDWDYWIGMARAGRPFALLDEPLITYRYDTGTLREHGKTIKPEMLKTLRAKHAGKVNEKMACMGCKKKLVAPMPVRKSNLEGEEMTAKDSDFVLARYVRPSNGSQGVVGAAQFPTAISQNMRRVRGGWVMWYGYHSPGDVFLVHKADVRTQPGWFQPVKETVQASPVGDRAATLSNRVPTREAALPPAPVTVKPAATAATTTTTAPTATTTAKPAAPRTFDFQTLPGVTPSIAAQLAKIYDGPAAIVAGGVELLMQVRGVGEAKAAVIIEAAQGMLVPPPAPVNTKDPIVELVGELEKVAAQGMPAPPPASAPDTALIEQLEKVL